MNIFFKVNQFYLKKLLDHELKKNMFADFALDRKYFQKKYIAIMMNNDIISFFLYKASFKKLELNYQS